MPRKEPEEDQPADESQEQNIQAGVMEVEINLSLLNNKLNFIIAKLDEIAGQKK